MVKLSTKSIIFTVLIMNITILTFTLPEFTLNGYSQNSDTSEFNTKLYNNNENLDIQSPNTNNTVKEKNPYEEIVMKVNLLPNLNKYLKGWYQISNFTNVATNTSKLCPSGNCEYELKNGEMAQAFGSAERSLIAKILVDTGIAKEPMNLTSIWKAVKEFKTNGETIQLIEGTLVINDNSIGSENKYKINGTLSTYDDNYFLEVKGVK